MTERIRVLICDDQAVVREGLAAILSTANDVEVIGLAANGREALEALKRQACDVVLMDLNMPLLNGVQATRQIKAQFPDTKVLVLTTYATDEWLFDAIRAGATGYLLKDTRRDELLRAIEQAAKGKAQLSPEVASKLMAHAVQGSETDLNRQNAELMALLTERELAILRLLSQGLSNGQIAQRLELSTGTVRNYVSEILAKLEVTDRTQAAVIAAKVGLIS